MKYKKVAALDLGALRQARGLSQKAVANYFDLKKKNSYKSIIDWEAGVAKPLGKRRAMFFVYLHDKLGLRHQPDELETIWHILEEEWGHGSLAEEEQPRELPEVLLAEQVGTDSQPAPVGLSLPDRPTSVSQQTGSAPQPITVSQNQLSAKSGTKKLFAKPQRWFIGVLVVGSVLLAGLTVSSSVLPQVSPGCTVANAANQLAGVLDIDCQGLPLISNYLLWFTSKANGRWQIWRLDPRSGEVKPIIFKIQGNTLEFDQFVPAVSPNGKQIVFAVSPCSTTERCGRDLYLASLVTFVAHPLVADPCLDEYHPAWSPDGQTIVYHAGSDDLLGCSATPYGIWLVDLQEPTQARQLTNKRDYDPVWSPSGRYIAYHSGSAGWNIVVLDYQACTLSANSCQSWSATASNSKATAVSWINDHRVVFVAGPEGAREIYEIPVKPGKTYHQPFQLTHNQWDDEYPAVFDSKILLWQAFQYEAKGNEGIQTDRDAVIHVMDLQKGEELPLLTGIGNARDVFLSRRQ